MLHVVPGIPSRAYVWRGISSNGGVTCLAATSTDWPPYMRLTGRPDLTAGRACRKPPQQSNCHPVISGSLPARRSAIVFPYQPSRRIGIDTSLCYRTLTFTGGTGCRWCMVRKIHARILHSHSICGENGPPPRVDGARTRHKLRRIARAESSEYLHSGMFLERSMITPACGRCGRGRSSTACSLPLQATTII